MIPDKQDTEDDVCVTLVLGRTTIDSWCIIPTQWSCKRWQVTIPPATGATSVLTKDRLQEHQKEASVPEFTINFGLCRPRRGSSATSLRGTRDGLIWEQVLHVCVCVCVCVILLSFCYVDAWAEPSPSFSALLHLLALHLFCLACVSSLLCISCLFCISPALVT